MKTKKFLLIILAFVLIGCIIVFLLINIKNLQVIADSARIDDKEISYSENISYETGKINNKNGEIWFEDDVAKLNLSDYQYFYIDYCNYEKLYLANIFNRADTILNEYALVSIRLISQDFEYPYGDAEKKINYNLSSTNNIEVLYFNNKSEVLVKVYAVIDNNSFDCLIKDATDSALIDNETEKKVFDISYNFEREFKSNLSAKILQNSNAQLLSYSAIDECSIGHTNSDRFIKEYIKSYKRKQYYTTMGTYQPTGNDPIVNIIPYSLFRRPIIYSFIGLEYGFYIHTYEDYGDNNYSEIFVFDVEHKQKISGQMGGVKVTPLFSGVLYFESSTDTISYRNKAIVTETMNPNLALSNISVSLGLTNNNAPNIGDDDYKANDDVGNYISSTLLTVNGVGSNENKGVDFSVAKVVLGSILGQIPKVGNVIKTISSFAFDIADIIANNAITNAYYNEMFEVGLKPNSNNSFDFEEFNAIASVNSEAVREKYGALPRAIDVAIDNQDVTKNQNALLYKTPSDYFNFEFGLAMEERNSESTISHQIKLDIVKDNDLFSAVDISYMDTAQGGCVYDYRDIPKENNNIPIEENMWVDAAYYNGSENKVEQTFIFSPEYSTTYFLAGRGDFHFKIAEDSDKTIYSCNYTDGSVLLRTFNLKKDHKYIIYISSTKTDDTLDTGLCQFLIGRYANKVTIMNADSKAIPIYNIKTGEGIWYYFKPSTSNFYTVQSINYDDSYFSSNIIVYDASFNELNYNESLSMSRFGMPFQKNVYYIYLENVGINDESEGGLMISEQQKITLYLDRYQNDYESKTGSAQYYWFMVPERGMYEIYEDSNYIENDSIITIYDTHMNIVATADDYNGSKSAYLKVSLKTTYYLIKIEIRSSYLSEGRFYVERL